MNKTRFLTIGAMCSFLMTVVAQPTVTLQSNRVAADLPSNGFLFNPIGFRPWVDNTELPPLIRECALWVSATAPDGTEKGAIAYRGKSDFSLGAINHMNGAAINMLQGKVWKVTAAEIEAHKADYADNGVINAPIPAIFAWPARYNPYFSDYNNGLPLPPTAIGLAEFRDRDQDGYYNPNNGDYPTVMTTGCEGTAPIKEIYWYVYNGSKSTEPASDLQPIKLEIQTTVFVLDCAKNAPLANTVFSVYKIINRESEILQNARFGMYTDFSVGSNTDDYMGFDQSRALVFAYNADAVDQSSYNAQVPAVGQSVLKVPRKLVPGNYIEAEIQSAVAFDGVQNLTTQQALNLLNGLNPDGSPVANGGFSYLGNPLDPNSASELNLGTAPGRRSVVVATEPFELHPGAYNEWIVAHYYTQNTGYSNLENLGLAFPFSDVLGQMDGACFKADAVQDACAELTAAEQTIYRPDFNIVLSPNPTMGTLKVEATTDAQLQSVAVYRMQGDLVSQQNEVGHNSTYLNMEDLPAGMYIVQATMASGATVMGRVVLAR